MSTQFLKAEFLTYLSAKNGAVGQDSAPKYNTEAGDLCITLYASEFKEFLSSSHYADASVLSKSIGEILSMDFENGRLVDKEDETTDTFESQSNDGQEQEPSSQLTQESMLDFISAVDSAMAVTPAPASNAPEPVTIGSEPQADTPASTTGTDANTTSGPTSVTTQNTNTDTENKTETPKTPDANTEKSTLTGNSSNYSQDVQKMLDEIYNSPEALKYLDLDGDGKIDDAEKLLFEKFVQGDKDSLTAEDLKNALKEMKEGKFKYDPASVKFDEPTAPTTPSNMEEMMQQMQQQMQQMQQAQQSGASAGGGGGGGGSYSSTAKDGSDSSDLSKMSVEKLNDKKAEKEQTVADKRNEVNAVYDGTNAKVAKAQKDYDTKKEAYEEALDNDENVKQETKEREKANLQEIETTRSQLNTLNAQKTTLDGKVSAAESVVAADESNIAALEDAVESYDSESSGKEEDQADIEAQKAEIQRQLDDAKTKREQDQATVDTLKAQQTELDASIQEQEAKISELEATRKEIEEEIMTTASDSTKEALKAFQDAKDGPNGVDTVREKELSVAKGNLETAQTELDKVNDAINVKQAKETQAKLGYKNYDKIAKIFEKYKGMSEGEIAQIMTSEEMKALGVSYHNGVYCADFVEMVLLEALGEDKLPDWYKNVSNKASCPSIQHQAAGHEVSPEEAQEGDIVLFDWDGDGTADHIGLFSATDFDVDPNGILVMEGNTELGGSVGLMQRYLGSVLGIYSIRD